MKVVFERCVLAQFESADTGKLQEVLGGLGVLDIISSSEDVVETRRGQFPEPFVFADSCHGRASIPIPSMLTSFRKCGRLAPD